MYVPIKGKDVDTSLTHISIRFKMAKKLTQEELDDITLTEYVDETFQEMEEAFLELE